VTRKKVAVLFPSFNGGGAESCCWWTLQTFQDLYEVHLFTFSNLDLAKVDHYTGTKLNQGELHIHCPVPRWGSPLVDFFFSKTSGFRRFRQHLLMKYLKSFRSRMKVPFDLCFSAYNEMDMRQIGLQYLHDFPGSRTDSGILKAWTGYSDLRVKQNGTLVPSRWMAGIVEKAMGTSPQVLHPPVRSEFPEVKWADREDGFICVARLSSEKKVEEAIEILRRVRKEGHNIHLHIVTAAGKIFYERKIRRLAKKHRDWIFIEKNLSDREYRRMLATHRYGINAAKFEGFGIAIAEMLNAGCLPFAMGNEEGQSEVLGSQHHLKYRNLEEGVERILEILKNPAGAQAKRDFSVSQRLFTVERFSNELRDIVAQKIEAIEKQAQPSSEGDSTSVGRTGSEWLTTAAPCDIKA
jgi:glycosyltransferase involved in cell wall biosynthesis